MSGMDECRYNDECVLCLSVSMLSVYLYLNHLCLCVCVLTHVCMMHCLEVPEYISRCVQSGAGLWLLYFFFPLIPALAPLKWQFVKHGPLLALSLASQPFPCTTTPLPHLSSPSPLRITRFTSFSHFPVSLLSFPYLPCTLHPRLSPSRCLFISLCCSLSLSLICPS